MSVVSTRAGNVTYHEQGEGVPIVMLHATLHDSHDYDGIATKLAEHYRTIAVDWPWHGESVGLPEPQLPSASLFADVLEDIITALNLPPAVFIGNSVGGFAAARLAISHPDRVRALVLVNTGGFVVWNPLIRFMCRLLGTPSVTRQVLPYLVPRYMKAQTPEDEAIASQVAARAAEANGAATAAALWRSFTSPDYDLRSRANEIKAPTLIVWGAQDPVASLSVGRATHEIIATSKLEILQAGHVVFSSKPAEFLRVVEPFIEAALAEEVIAAVDA